MDLHHDIKKVTSLSLLDKGKFYRLKELSQAEKDRKMNEKKVKTPRNSELLESDSDNSFNENIAQSMNKVKPTFDRYEIAAAIKEANGGRDLSNEYCTKYWENRLKQMANSEKQPTKATNAIRNSSQDNKIFRNAAIMGLVNMNKISLSDVVNLSDKSTKEENRLKTAINEEYNVEFVPLCEDPEVYVHPLRMGIDVKNFKDIDFTVPSVGKKIKETPQEYFVRTTNDNSFEFVKSKNTI